jgi:hypothetical protein
MNKWDKSDWFVKWLEMARQKSQQAPPKSSATVAHGGK